MSIDYERSINKLRTDNISPRLNARDLIVALLWLTTKESAVPAFIDEIASAYETEVREVLKLSSSVRFLWVGTHQTFRRLPTWSGCRRSFYFRIPFSPRQEQSAHQSLRRAGDDLNRLQLGLLFVATRGSTNPLTMEVISDSLGITKVTVSNAVKHLQSSRFDENIR